MIALTRRTAFVAVVSPFFSQGALAATSPTDDVRGPFGLTWGESSDEVRKLGVTLGAFPAKSDYGVAFTATDLSKVLSDMETVALFFGFRDKLSRVAAVGRSVGPDPYGNQVTARYQDIASSLAERYGRGTETDIRDHEMWKAPNEYMMSLKQGRAFRYTTFQTASVSVELSVRSSGSDTGNYLILFAYRPAMQELEVDKKNRERETL